MLSPMGRVRLAAFPYELIRVLIGCSQIRTVPDGVRGRGMKFGIGQPMRRHEDLLLITGRGCYTDDVILPRMTHAFVLRSPAAHAQACRHCCRRQKQAKPRSCATPPWIGAATGSVRSRTR